MDKEDSNRGDNPEIEHKDKNEQRLNELNRIFEAGEVTVDVSELKQMLIDGKDHAKIMEDYFQNLPKKQYSRIESVLASPEFEKWKQPSTPDQPKVDAKSMKLDLMFARDDIKHDVKELKQALLKNQKYDEILEEYEDSFSAKQMRIINQILKSKQLETLLKQNLENQGKFKIEEEVAKLFSHINADTTKLQKLLIQGQKIDEILLQYQNDLTGKNYKAIQVVIKSEALRKLLTRDQQSEKNKKIKQISQVLYKSVKKQFDISELAQAIAQKREIKDILEKYSQLLTGKELTALKKTLESSEMQAFMTDNQQDIYESTFAKIFSKIKADLTLLKQAVFSGLDIEEAMKQLQDSLKGSDFNELKKTINSEQFKKFKQGLKKKNIKDYDRKFDELSNIIRVNFDRKQLVLQNILLKQDISEIYQDLLHKENPQVIEQLHRQLFSEKFDQFLAINDIKNYKITMKIPIYLKQRTVWVNQKSKVLDIKKQYKISEEEQFFTLENQIIPSDCEIEGPAKLTKCSQFTVMFQGESFSLYLPLVKIGKVISILQKLLKTNLRLKIKIYRKDQFVQEDDNYSLQMCSNRNISISYYINLLVMINEKEMSFEILSSQTIGQIKDRIQDKIGIKKKSQRWYIEGNEVTNDNLVIQNIGIGAQIFRICIEEIITLQFYGFTKISPIKRSVFKEFYIEDDEKFIQTIKASNFPELSYSQAFKSQILGYIFSAIKKHSLMQSCLKHIQDLVEKSDKEDLLWKPSSISQKCLFNQWYVLSHILKCSQTALRIDIMRGLMISTKAQISLSSAVREYRQP